MDAMDETISDLLAWAKAVRPTHYPPLARLVASGRSQERYWDRVFAVWNGRLWSFVEISGWAAVVHRRPDPPDRDGSGHAAG